MQDPLFSMTHKLSSVAPSKDFKIKVPENFGIAQLCKFCSPIGEKKMSQVCILWNIPQKNPLNDKGRTEHTSTGFFQSQEAGR